MSTYDRLEAAFAGRDAPFAFVDIDALRPNGHEMLGLAGGKPIRVARSRCAAGRCWSASWPRPALPWADDLHAAETLWLHAQGFHDLLLAYPTTDRARLAELGALGTTGGRW